jgi:xylan 1,4-beta-xylosidase
VRVELAHVPPGRYTLRVHQVGYRVNVAYAVYKDLGSPAQLTRAQVARIDAASSGKPVSERAVTVPASGLFATELPLRENDVYLLTLSKSSRNSFRGSR